MSPDKSSSPKGDPIADSNDVVGVAVIPVFVGESVLLGGVDAWGDWSPPWSWSWGWEEVGVLSSSSKLTCLMARRCFFRTGVEVVVTLSWMSSSLERCIFAYFFADLGVGGREEEEMFLVFFPLPLPLSFVVLVVLGPESASSGSEAEYFMKDSGF